MPWRCGGVGGVGERESSDVGVGIELEQQLRRQGEFAGPVRARLSPVKTSPQSSRPPTRSPVPSHISRTSLFFVCPARISCHSVFTPCTPMSAYLPPAQKPASPEPAPSLQYYLRYPRGYYIYHKQNGLNTLHPNSTSTLDKTKFSILPRTLKPHPRLAHLPNLVRHHGLLRLPNHHLHAHDNHPPNNESPLPSVPRTLAFLQNCL